MLTSGGRIIRCVFYLLVAGTTPVVSQQSESEREASSEGSEVKPALRGYKDIFLLAGLGTEELLGFKGEFQFFRGLYVTAGGGYSFEPFANGYFPTAAREFNCGVTWRWYNSKYTPIIRATAGRAFWPASDYNPVGNVSYHFTEKGDVYSFQFGVEHRNSDGGCIGVMVGGNWWQSAHGEKTDRASIQFYGGFAL